MLSPFLVDPVFRNRVWGGDRLGPWLAPNSPASDQHQRARTRGGVGEAWLIADLPATTLDGKTRISSGDDAGQTLGDLMQNPVHRRALLGRSASMMRQEDSGFPLLIKLLDAGTNLSVQVHPDSQYSARNPHAHMKSEMWLVLEAVTNAVIYRGVRPEVSRAQFAEHVAANRLLDILIAVPARKGDCIWLPSGICHALGAGTLAAEVQTPSDTTFRLWDWGRKDPARPLHLAEAMECLLLGADQQLDQLDRPRQPIPIHSESISIEPLVRTEWFDVERWVVQPGTTLQHDGIGVPVVWTILGGKLAADCLPQPLCRGTTIVLPAEHSGLTGAAADGPLEILVTTLPDPLKNTVDFGGSRIA